MISTYLKSLSGPVTVVTANQRLSAWLHHHYQIEQRNSGLKSWPTPDILPLDAWITRSFMHCGRQNLLLSEYQERLLWQEIIAADLAEAENPIIFNDAVLAQSAGQAWKLVQQWQIPLSKLAQSDSVDGRLFYGWLKRFQEICRQRGWSSSQDTVEAVAEAITTNLVSLPPHFVLAGFEEIPPQIYKLLAVIHQHSEVHHYQTQQSPIQIQQIALPDEKAELYRLAQWAQAELMKNPQATIGCVIPQLTQIRHKVERIFQEVFADYSNPEQQPFNISGGKPLLQYPLIASAMQIWQSAAQSHIDLKNLSELLGSPFIAGESELTARALFMVGLYKQGENTISWRKLLNSLAAAKGCVISAERLSNFIARNSAKSSKTASAWANCFAEQLQELGWPGDHSLNSAEYQQQQRLESLLQEFAGLDAIFPQPIPLTTALQHLRVLLQNTVFQAKSASAPIQVLGLLEAVGLNFDRLWVMGMNDEQWPAPATPTPLLPLALQRHYNLPHSSSAREFAFSQKITARFIDSAEEIVFSYSQMNKDIILRPSALIRDFKKAAITTIQPVADLQANNLEFYVDHQGPKIPTDTTVKGGAGILKDQAACPFRAFARHRLAAQKIPRIFSGLSPQDRGIYLHEIMEKIWGILQSQAQLCRYTENDLQKLLTTVIQQVLTAKAQQRSILKNRKFFAVEQTRLQEIITQWLMLEKQRPDFQVLAREKAQTLQIAGLHLQLRVDREDQLASGEHLIIDYKTGETQIKDWFGERPGDPQLPLYCLTAHHNVQGIVFAQLGSQNKLQFKGISAEDYQINGVCSITKQKIAPELNSWEVFQQEQQRNLTQLAQAFLNAQAEVDPKDGEACRYCDLQALCRIHSHAISTQESEEEDAA